MLIGNKGGGCKLKEDRMNRKEVGSNAVEVRKEVGRKRGIGVWIGGGGAREREGGGIWSGREESGGVGRRRVGREKGRKGG